MPLQTIKPSQIGNNGISVLLYGESGTGKTTFLSTLKGKTLIIDVDKGTSVFKKMNLSDDFEIYHLKDDLSNLQELLTILLTEDLGFNNICFDTITELEKAMLILYGKTSKIDSTPEQRHYQTVQYKVRSCLRTLRDLTLKQINIIITAWEMPYETLQKDGVITSKMYPMLSGKLPPEAVGLFDIVGRIVKSEKEETKGQRFILLQGNDRFTAKDRLSKNNRLFCKAEGKDLFNIK
jgi:phage nucleotide-binding protein